MKILDLALKDLTQMLRDKKSVLFLVAMPIVFTLFMGFAYRSGENTPEQEQRIPLAWVEASPSALSEMFYARLEETGALQPVRLEEAAALDSLQHGEVAGVLLIPAGFGQADAAAPQPQITLIVDTASTTGQSVYQLLRGPLSQLMSAAEIGQMSAETQGDPAEYSPALELAWQKWSASSSEPLVQLEQAAAQTKDSWYGDNPYNQASPGILVQFAILGLVTSAQILVQERKTRTLQRLKTTSMQPWQIFAGHMLAMFTIIFLQLLLLVIVGQFFLGVNYLRQPLGSLLVTVALSLWVAAMGLLIGVISKSDDQAVLYAMLAMFIFSALGGAWFPLEGAGELFSTIGKIFPSAWAMIGLQNILIRSLGLSSLWQPVAILLAYALGFFALAAWKFRTLE